MKLIETGRHTNTGGRIKQLIPHLGPETFMITWGDGVSTVDLDALVAFHKDHGKLCTLTAVHPPARYGHIEICGDQITEFTEKPQAAEGWINGAFFVMEPEVADYIEGDDTLVRTRTARATRCRRPVDGVQASGFLGLHGHRSRQGHARKAVGDGRRALEGVVVRVLVTGHDGYIGTILVPMLQSRGHQVIGMDSMLFEQCAFGPRGVETRCRSTGSTSEMRHQNTSTMSMP